MDILYGKGVLKYLSWHLPDETVTGNGSGCVNLLLNEIKAFLMGKDTQVAENVKTALPDVARAA